MHIPSEEPHILDVQIRVGSPKSGIRSCADILADMVFRTKIKQMELLISMP